MPRELTHKNITDHVVVRYMERVLGFDVQALKQEIAETANEAVPFVDEKNTRNPICETRLSNGTVFVLSGRRVVTCYKM